MKGAETKESSPKANVFLGCSAEAAEELAPTIQEALSRIALVKIWNQSVFAPGTYVPDQIIAHAKDFDFAIMLLSADDLIEFRGDTFSTARDNTVFESGLFMAFLGRQRTFLLVPDIKDMRIPSDLAGLTTIRYPAEMTATTVTWELEPACRTMRRVIEELGPRARMPDLTGGMTVTLSAFARAKVVKHSQVTALLARYNGQLQTSNMSGWEKAADYCVHHLEHLGLVEKFMGRRVGAKLTPEGERVIASVSFKEHFKNFVGTDRGRDVPQILSDLFAREPEGPTETGEVSRPNFRR